VHPVKVQRLLRRAVEEVLGSTDPDGLARILLPPIRELFRAGADVDADPGSPRARRVMEVALAYRTLLRTEGLIDPAEGSAVVPVMCGNCGYTMLFSPRMLPDQGE
jgi:hypothetical protein